MAKESGIATPTADDLVRVDRARTGKKLSNADWECPINPDAKIAKLKDGRTRLAYKPEHELDLDTGAIIAAELHEADQGEPVSLTVTLEAMMEQLAALDAAPGPEAPAELPRHAGGAGGWAMEDARVSDGSMGFGAGGDHAARRAVYNNRARLLSGVAGQAFGLRTEWVDRSFAFILDRGAMRRVWLRGRANIHERYLIHVAGYNLGLMMRLLTGAGPRANSMRGVPPICPVLSCRMLHFSPSLRWPTGTHSLFSPFPSKPTRSTERRLSQQAVNPTESQNHQASRSFSLGATRVWFVMSGDSTDLGGRGGSRRDRRASAFC
jgi:hypothetical protein